MIDLDRIRKQFHEYVSNYDINNSKIKLKYEHTLRVVENCKVLANELKLNEEDTKLACLIGYLHDIGRFEQAKVYGTFKDNKSIDHADYSIEQLFEKGEIRKYIDEIEYDEIIYVSVKYHNKIDIKDGIDERTKLFAELIKDADKIDIFRVAVINKSQDFYEVNKYDGNLTKSVEKTFYEHKLINITQVKTVTDKLALIIAFVYDINIKKSFEIIKKEKLIEKVVEIFLQDYNVQDDKKIQKMKREILNYMRIKKKNSVTFCYVILSCLKLKKSI
ncbi:MAG: HD domain-containing protein [Clostridiaceae bacterium]|nr:HD domain-containing protein [Clostridiaceae bacterium]